MKFLRCVLLAQLFFYPHFVSAETDTLKTYATKLIAQISEKTKSQTENLCIVNEVNRIGYKISDDSIIGASLNSYAYILRQANQFEVARDSASKAEHHFKNINDNFGLTDTYIITGLCYYSEGNLPSAILYFHQSIELAKATGDTRLLARSLLNAGLAYLNVRNYEEAEISLNQGIEQFKKLNDSISIGYSYENLGLIYTYKNEYKKALKYQFSAARIYKNLGSVNTLPSVYDNIGFAYEGMEDYDNAIKHYQFCVDTAEKYNVPYYIAFGHVDLGRALLKIGDYTKSIIHLIKGHDLAIAQNCGEIISESYSALSDYYLKIGRPYKSREMLLDYIEYYKKSFNESTTAQLKSLQGQLDKINKDREKEQLKTSLEVERIKTKQASRTHISYLIATTLLIALLIVMTYVLINNYRRGIREKQTNQRLKELNEELESMVESRTKELQISLNKVQDLERIKNAFLNNISHEIRTPLNGILGFSRFLSSGELTKEEKNEYGTYIEKLGTRLLRILDDVLELSRIETNQLDVHVESCNINSLISSIYTTFIASDQIKGKEIELVQHKALPDVNAFFSIDEPRLYRILENLIDNAIKFTPKGKVEFGYMIDENQVLRFFVKDTGIGIPAKEQERIFERFYRHTSNNNDILYEGAGVGLTIAKGFAIAMGGRIDLVSEENKGSTFYLILPQIQIEDKWGNFLKDRTILIAEDDIITSQLIERLLSNKGARVIITKNAEDAIDICEFNNNINAVILDIQLPFMNGYEAARKLKLVNPNLPIVAQSSSTTGNEALLSQKMGCDAFIAKPIDYEELLKTLRKLIVS